MGRSTVIEASVAAPHIVEVPRGAKTVSVVVRTELRNGSEHDYVLHAHRDDRVHFCQLLDENHREIWREQSPKGAVSRENTKQFPARCQTIAAGHSVHQNETLSIAAAKLKDGHTYTLRHEVWGHMAETSVVAIHAGKAQPRKAAPAKKTSVRKASSKKKPSKKTGRRAKTAR